MKVLLAKDSLGFGQIESKLVTARLRGICLMQGAGKTAVIHPSLPFSVLVPRTGIFKQPSRRLPALPTTLAPGALNDAVWIACSPGQQVRSSRRDLSRILG